MKRGGRESGVSAVQEAERAARPSEPNAAANSAAHSHYPYNPPEPCIYCQEERIRALEAEVKEYLELIDGWELHSDAWRSRAEKAEAEVERLKEAVE